MRLIGAILLVAAGAACTGASTARAVQAKHVIVAPHTLGSSLPSGETDELSEIQIDARVVQRLLAKKRAEKDVVWVVCLDQKLVQIDDALGSARDARNGLSEADEHGDLSLAEHQKTILGVLRQRADRLREEGMRCDNLR